MHEQRRRQMAEIKRFHIQSVVSARENVIQIYISRGKYKRPSRRQNLQQNSNEIVCNQDELDGSFFHNRMAKFRILERLISIPGGHAS